MRIDFFLGLVSTPLLYWKYLGMILKTDDLLQRFIELVFIVEIEIKYYNLILLLSMVIIDLLHFGYEIRCGEIVVKRPPGPRASSGIALRPTIK